MRTVNPSRTEVVTLRRATVRGPESGRSGRRGYVCSPTQEKKGVSELLKPLTSIRFLFPYFLD
jgi:hypothetical protein